MQEDSNANCKMKNEKCKLEEVHRIGQSFRHFAT